LLVLLIPLALAINQPTLNYPLNQTFTNNNTPDFNFTVTGNETSYSCELFLNDTGYGENSSVLNNTATIITANSSIPDSFYNWYINCTNSTTNQSEVREITIDTVNPLISFDTGTESNNYYRNQTYIPINWTLEEANLKNITVRLYNSTLHNINTTTFVTATYEINFTGLSEGAYYYNISIYDNASNYNETETRKITLDNTVPVISGESHTSISGRNILWIYEDEDVWLNATVTDINLDTVLLSSNFNGTWVNYSTEGSYSFRIGKGNLSHSQVQYRFWANDTASNEAWGNLKSFTPIEVEPEPTAQTGNGGSQGTGGTGISPQTMEYICDLLYQFSIGNLIDYKINYTEETFNQLKNDIYLNTGVGMPIQQLKDYIISGEAICNYTLPEKPKPLTIVDELNLTETISNIKNSSFIDTYLPFPHFTLSQVEIQKDRELGWVSLLNIPFYTEYSNEYSDYPNIEIMGIRWIFIIGVFLLIVSIKKLKKKNEEREEIKEKRKSLIFKLANRLKK